jgi:hypothetical protein
VRYLSSGVKSKVLEVKEKFVSFVHVLTAPPHVNVRNRAFLQKLTGSSVIASMTDLLGSENLVITETQSLAIDILARIISASLTEPGSIAAMNGMASSFVTNVMSVLDCDHNENKKKNALFILTQMARFSSSVRDEIVKEQGRHIQVLTMYWYEVRSFWSEAKISYSHQCSD